MCGLAGYVGIDETQGLPLLRRMADLQAHRGPDGAGFFQSGRVGLAHRRLAVIDKVGGEQPMRSADGRYVLVYNGEVYNFRELRAELTALGHEFTTQSDTEVVLAAWARWGYPAFDRFNGMFALAIADTVGGQVVLARDHFGIKPLYYAADQQGRVVFASEIRPILAAGLVERRPDDVTLYRYLRYRVHDDTERTFFAGVKRVMPGECATITPAGRVYRTTYTPLFAELLELAEYPAPYDEKAREQFAAALRAAVRARLVSDVPVGSALSGGLDSSTVVALVNELIQAEDAEAAAVGDRQRSFSAVFPGERNDEERYVDVMARRYDSLRVHKVRPTADEFLVDLPDFVYTQEEPVISTGPYAQYCVMREASQHVTVMLDGQGADEMMAGYLPYYLVRLRDLRRRGQRRNALRELFRSLDVLWRLGRFRLVDMLLGRRNVPITELLNHKFAATHAAEALIPNPDDLKTRLVDDIFRHSLPALLRYEDRNSMRFSLEGRVPFLDVNLLRLLWGMDETAILHEGWNKRVLRDCTAKLLPAEIRKRRNKIGFTTPEDAWFARIKSYAYEVFSSPSFGSRRYFDQQAVLDAFRRYLRGRGGADTMTFWRLLNVELWLRTFIDEDPCRTRPDTATAFRGGRHPQAPPKSDYLPNPEKEIVLAGTRWARYPLRVDLIACGDDIAALCGKRASEFFAGLPAARTSGVSSTLMDADSATASMAAGSADDVSTAAASMAPAGTATTAGSVAPVGADTATGSVASGSAGTEARSVASGGADTAARSVASGGADTAAASVASNTAGTARTTATLGPGGLAAGWVLAGAPWYLYVSEKVVAVAQGRSYRTEDVHPGRWARILSRFVVRTPWGIGLGHPVTMQLAIQEAGLPRILVAATVGAIGKAIGRRGWFYRVAGDAVRAIDGPTEYSAYPSNVSAKLAPRDPAGVAREISAAVRAATLAAAAARFGGTVVIDANDLGCNVLGQDTTMPDAFLAKAFTDNPLGQGREQTPFAIVVDGSTVPDLEAAVFPSDSEPSRLAQVSMADSSTVDSPQLG